LRAERACVITIAEGREDKRGLVVEEKKDRRKGGRKAGNKKRKIHLKGSAGASIEDD